MIFSALRKKATSLPSRPSLAPGGGQEEGCKKRLKWMLGNMLAGGFGGKCYSAPLKSHLNFLSTLWSKVKGSIDFRYVWKLWRFLLSLKLPCSHSFSRVLNFAKSTVPYFARLYIFAISEKIKPAQRLKILRTYSLYFRVFYTLRKPRKLILSKISEKSNIKVAGI